MLQFEPLTLDKKELFDSFMRGKDYFQAETSFANLYIWRHSWSVQMAVKDDALFLLSNSETRRPFMLPPFLKRDDMSIVPAMREAEEYMNREFGAFYMKGATTNAVDQIRRECGSHTYRFRYDESSSEYVYNVRDLIDLAGKKYHSKRNHISVFLRNNYPATAQYCAKYRDECLALQEEWARMRGSDQERSTDEYISIETALDNYEALGLRGMVVFLDNKMAAFTFGEPLNDRTCLIHIEKARPEVNGLFTYVNQQFLRLDWGSFEYVNREEDMGIPGLRQAKRSYHPAFMVDKFDVFRETGR